MAIDYWLNETLNVLDKKNMKLSFHESKIKPLELEIFQRKTELIEIEFACTRPENINQVENLLKKKLNSISYKQKTQLNTIKLIIRNQQNL